MTKEIIDPFLDDPLIEKGIAKVAIVVHSVHVGCPGGNGAKIEIAMSNEYYKGQRVHLESAYFVEGQAIPPTQNCTTCGKANALVYLGSDII